MALINSFEDAANEQEYFLTERISRRKTTRTLLVIGAVMYLGFFMMTPIFTANETFVAFNLTTIVLVCYFILCFYLIETRYYIDWPILDTTPFFLVTITAAIILSMLFIKGETSPLAITIMMIGFFAGVIFIACIGFAANFKYFLLLMCCLSATLIGALVLINASISIKLFAISYTSLLLLLAIYSNWEFDRRGREIYVGKQLLDAERKKTEALLYNVLPQAVAKRLRAGEVVADSFSDISIIFVDIVGFSKLTKQLSPGHLVEQLNRFFHIADQCADRYGIEKVKTIGDCYLAVSGGTASGGHGAQDAVSFAKDVIAEMQDRAKDCGVDIKLRVGIHSGPVVGGVVGANRLAYDYWGDTMNVASRIEGVSEPNGIAVSAATYFQCNGSHEFGLSETVTLKGVGETEIYRLKTDVA